MPLAGAPGAPRTVLDALVPLLDAPFHPLGVAVAQIVTLPGQVVISFLLVAVAAGALWRQGRRTAAVAWPAAWLLATTVEVVFRHTLSRPAIYRDGVHVVGFDASWPSGHALRCTLVACALGAAWPRLRIPLGIWLVAAVVLLELAGFHTPTDVVGGLLLATVAAAVAFAAERSGQLRLGRPRRGGLRRPGAGAAR